MRPLVYLLLLGMALSQTPENVTFRGGTQEVLVDAAVFDKKGNFQGDLTRDDFQLLEDGKPQKITSFSLVDAASAHGPRFLAVLFDEEDPSLREEVLQFASRTASPELYFAVFDRLSGDGQVHLVLPFTTEPARIAAALQGMQSTRRHPADPATTTPGDIMMSNPLLDWLTYVADAIAPVHGRKALLLFSNDSIIRGRAPHRQPDGSVQEVVYPTDETMKKAIDGLNADSVSVYSFVPRPPAAQSIGQSTWQDLNAGFFRDLAVGTGGKYTPPGEYDLASYLNRVATSRDDHYLLGYTPAPGSASKPCHKLKVKVARNGLEVTARDSYCTSDEPPERALKSAEKALESRPIAGLPAPGMQLSWFYSKPGAAIVDLAIDLDPHGKQFNLLGVVYREDGSVQTRLGDTVKLDADAPTPYHYSHQLDLPPGRYRIRVTAGAGGVLFAAAAEKTIEIAPWDGDTLSASGIALAASASRITGVTAELSSSLLDGPHRLAAQGWQIEPMGATEFRADTNGTLYFEIYAPHESAPPAPRMRIVHRATGEEQIDSGPMEIGDFIRAGDPVIPVALTLPVSKLPAGAYTLEIRLGDNILRSADFEVK